MVNEIKISIRAYARQLHVDEKAVRKAINEGKIKKGFDKKTNKITASIANKEWGFLHTNPKPQRGVSKAKVVDKLAKKGKGEKPEELSDKGKKNTEDDSFNEDSFTYSQLIDKIKIHPDLAYNEAVRRKEILGIANDKMKLEELQGLLVRKADIDKALYAIGVEFKKALLNIPARCINDIRAASTDVEAINILNAELQMVLTHVPAELKKT